MSTLTGTYPELLYKMPAAGAAYANSNVRTLVSGSTATFPPCRLPVEIWLPGNGIGKTLTVQAKGFYGTTATPTLTVAAAIDTTAGTFGTALAATGAYTAENTAAANTIGFDLRFDCTVHSEGSSGTVNAAGYYAHGTSGNASTAAGASIMVGSATDITLATNADNFLEIWATWGTAAAANTLVLTQFMVWCWN